ncbi:non-hydrolyzing UDP-N-acetylglucosamine 2-epimerase [Pedobacter deserti]|uniref:non-hydrolyzing UDP-N-acetylglucosamine 2-epimerase n=1 Tax=Pedobacter deserti TaxID=2817382 RepID=UPI00210B962D|nr:UDP-N-acetylglucosamine 2-epimerase (non-hydrolyzing) [Pedobacter sp. SYSU D00382]
MKKVLIVFGTRPEAIKMAPVVHAFRARSDRFDTRVCVTGQHREILDQVLSFFDIHPDYDLNIMKPGQDLNQLTAAVILAMAPVLDEFQPDLLFVHGDTTTSAICALAGYYAGVKVCHVEAGLRTRDIYSPFPEELNRQLTARIASLHFAPTVHAKANLVAEGINAEQVFITGNTIIDALNYATGKVDTVETPELQQLKSYLGNKAPLILVTCHRRENFGAGLESICSALKRIAESHDIQLIYPVHPNPNISSVVRAKLDATRNIHLIKPLSYPAFIWLMKNCKFIITDSGGIQEEGNALGKQVLLLRSNTERPEVLGAGGVQLVGTDSEAIVSSAEVLLNNPMRNSLHHFPYGNGHAAADILSITIQEYVQAVP